MNQTKKRLIPFAFAIAALSLGLAFAPSETDAQGALNARDVAARVQSFYDQTDTFKASFHQTYYHRAYGRYMRSRGEVAFDKPGQMRFDYDNGKVIVSNGERLIAYEPGDEGERGQYMETATNENALPDAFGFLTGTARIGETYRYRLLDNERWGYDGYVLSLTPRRADPRIRRVILFVDSDPSRVGVVHRIRIDDHDGNRNKFSLRRMRFNRELPTSRFDWTPPANARRIQQG